MRINLIITYEQDNERNIDVDAIDKLLEIKELKYSWLDVKNGYDGVNNYSNISLYQRVVGGITQPTRPVGVRKPKEESEK